MIKDIALGGRGGRCLGIDVIRTMTLYFKLVISRLVFYHKNEKKYSNHHYLGVVDEEVFFPNTIKD